MIDIDELQERKYQQVFEDTCQLIAWQRETNAHFTIETLEQLLDTAYVRAGNDWIGRGIVGDITNSATIAAYEHLLAEWRSETLNIGHENE